MLESRCTITSYVSLKSTNSESLDEVSSLVKYFNVTFIVLTLVVKTTRRNNTYVLHLSSHAYRESLDIVMLCLYSKC